MRRLIVGPDGAVFGGFYVAEEVTRDDAVAVWGDEQLIEIDVFVSEREDSEE